MLQGKTRLVNATTKFGGKVYDRFLIHIPSKVAKDSQFPFEAGDVLSIDVDPKERTITLSKTVEPQASRRRGRPRKR